MLLPWFNFLFNLNFFFKLLHLTSLLLLLLLSHLSRVRLCNPIDGSPPGSPVPGILQARTLEWVAISFSDAWKWSCPVVSDPQRPHGLQPSRLLCPWDFPGKSTGVGCHCLLLMTLLISWWLLLINSVLNNPVGFLYLSFNSLEFSPENNNNFTFFFLVFIFFSFSVSNLSSLIPSDQC